jgi:hypothetical protein
MSRRGTAGEDLDNDQTAAATGARLWEHGAVGRVNVLGAGGLGMRSWDVEELPCSREVVLALAFGGSRWISSRPNYFLPVEVLSRLFRRLCLEQLLAAHRAGRLQFFGDHALQ